MRILKFIIISLVMSLFFCSAGKADDPVKLFENANDLYREGETSDAIKIYEGLVSRGEVSAELFYNLGNFYLKEKEIGRAILNYERARISLPRDSDLVFNLEYAKSQVKQQDLLFQTDPFNDFLIRSTLNLSFNELIETFFVIFGLFLAFVIAGLYFKKFRSFILVLAFFMFISSIILILPIRYKFNYNNTTAIIMGDIIDARFEPDEKADSHFPLYEGNRVFVLRRDGDFMKVKRPDGKIGWIKTAEAEKLL